MTDRYRGQPVWPWVLAAVSVLAAIAAVAFLVRSLDGGPADTRVPSNVGVRAGALAADAEQINATWDAQRDVLVDEERAGLFREAADALEVLIADTDAFVADVQALESDPTLVAAAASMATAARDMLNGLNAPGRTNVSQRQAALATYLEASAAVARLAGG